MKPKQLYITLLLISFSQTIFAKCPDAQVPQNLKANESHTKTTWYSESPPSTNNINNFFKNIPTSNPKLEIPEGHRFPQIGVVSVPSEHPEPQSPQRPCD